MFTACRKAMSKLGGASVLASRTALAFISARRESRPTAFNPIGLPLARDMD
jgi:hypothetical protein